MEVSVINRIELPEIPSASGIQVVDDSIFIIGDDSPFLFELNPDYSLRQKIPLFEYSGSSERIPKPEKGDLEGLTLLKTEKMNLLLIAGSGSIPETREVCFLVDLSKNFSVKKLTPKNFYSRCRTRVEELGGGKLNLEAVCFRKGWLHFFHRGNITGVSVMLSLLWNDFLRFDGNRASSFHADKIVLPQVDGLYSGISGATWIPGTNQILFTASVEQSPNPVDDGRVVASSVGVLKFSGYHMQPPVTALITQHNERLSVKAESIAIKSSNKKEVIALCVCDSDGPVSELLEITILL